MSDLPGKGRKCAEGGRQLPRKVPERSEPGYGEPPLDENGRVRLYLQPGKHAVLPDPRLVRLVPQWMESCGELAGADGVPLPEMFQEAMPVPDQKTQDLVRPLHPQKLFLEPSLRFQPFLPEKELPAEELLIPWEQLKSSVPGRLKKELEKIREAE